MLLTGPSADLEAQVGFFKPARHPIPIAGLLEQRLRVPLTARHAKKIAAIDVNRPGQSGNRIVYRMNNVASERDGIFFAKRPSARSFDSTPRRARHTTPEDIVLATRVDTD